MHHVLSFQMSNRADNQAHEFVSKRLCCSFLFTVAFLSLLGGFLLGRYATEREFTIKESTNKQNDGHDIINLITSINSLEDQMDRIPPDLSTVQIKRLLELLECNYSLSTNDEIVVSYARKLVNLHVNMLTGCVNNASVFIQEDLIKLN